MQPRCSCVPVTSIKNHIMCNKSNGHYFIWQSTARKQNIFLIFINQSGLLLVGSDARAHAFWTATYAVSCATSALWQQDYCPWQRRNTMVRLPGTGRKPAKQFTILISARTLKSEEVPVHRLFEDVEGLKSYYLTTLSFYFIQFECFCITV